MSDEATPAAPDDEWDFVPRDDELVTSDDGDVPAEEAALHVVEDGVTRAADPGRSDVTVGDDDDQPAEAHFPDEDTGTNRTDGEHEPDLEEILESQHYAFPDEPDSDG